MAVSSLYSHFSMRRLPPEILSTAGENSPPWMEAHGGAYGVFHSEPDQTAPKRFLSPSVSMSS
jgi:hypothetical protein